MMAGDVNFGGTTSTLAAGKARTCAVLDGSGDVRCWGSNDFGSAGNQSTILIGETEQAAAAPLSAIGGAVVGLDAGTEPTCALLADDSVHCFGRLLYGRLGVPELTEDLGDDEAPSSVDPVDIGGAGAQVSAGSEHTCARLRGGAVRCRGNGLLDRLGYAFLPP